MNVIQKVRGLGRRGVLAIFVALLAVWSIASQVSKSSPASEPPRAPAPSAVKPDARLGSTRDIWIAAHGESRTARRGNEPMILGERFGPETDVARWVEGVDGQGRAAHVEVVLPRERPIAEAKAAAASLLPTDRTLAQTYTAPAGQTVEVFHSPQLASLFPPEAFGEESPGTFIQIAERGMPTTARVLIALGNRP